MRSEQSRDRFAVLRDVYAAALARAPGLRARFAAAGLDAADLTDAAALDRLPVLKKERLMEMQRQDPPYAGFLAAAADELAYIFVSPGPIFEPSLAEDTTGHGMDVMFAAAGVGRGDLALNTWSYHLVPAGLLFDRGLRAVGATVVPGGVGASELQAELLIKLGVTAFLGSTAFFLTLVERLEATGCRLPQDWRLKHAFLGGELGNWAAKRRQIEDKYNVQTWSCYATADFGLIGYEVAGESGYRIHPDRYLQVCDPVSGAPLPAGEAGEIVVTTLTPGWPMIRFGTGDVSTALEIAADGGVARIAPLQGRSGGAVKAREIFIYPGHVPLLIERVPGLARAALSVSRPASRDVVTARILLDDGAEAEKVEAELRAVFPTITRLTLDRIERVASAEAFGDAPALKDER
jgi:phenylacetate-CoA ligase